MAPVAPCAPIGPTSPWMPCAPVGPAAPVGPTAPGAPCAEIDEAANGFLRDEGLGEYLLHRTGHGFGLSNHEGPWVAAGSADEVRAL